MSIAEFASSPAAFREALVIPSAHGPARFGDVMADFQRKDFAALDPALLALANGSKPPCGRYWWERTKGASKDSDLATCLLWLLAFSRRPLTCQVGAADRDQADELRKAAKDILRLNPWLSEVVQIQSWTIVNTRTESACEIIAADIAGSHGARPDLLICNELSHVTKQEFVQNLFDNADKMPRGVAIVATNAGFLDTWQHEWRELARTSPRWSFHVRSEPAPWLDDATLEEAKRRNPPQRHARLWWGQWVHPSGDALDPTIIESAVVTSARPHETARQGFVYVAGCDLAVSRHHSAFVALARNAGWTETRTKPSPRLTGALAAMVDLGWHDTPPVEYEYVTHEGDGKVHLAHCTSWRPPAGGMVDYDAIESHVIEMHRRLRFSAVLFDRHQEHYLVARLRKRGVPAQVFNNSSAAEQESQALALLTGFQENRFVLFDEPDLLADLRLTQVVDKGSHVRLDWPQTAERGHCDRASAFALAALAMKRTAACTQWVDGPLLCSDDQGKQYEPVASGGDRLQELIAWMESYR